MDASSRRHYNPNLQIALPCVLPTIFQSPYPKFTLDFVAFLTDSFIFDWMYSMSDGPPYKVYPVQQEQLFRRHYMQCLIRLNRWMVGRLLIYGNVGQEQREAASVGGRALQLNGRTVALGNPLSEDEPQAGA